MSNLYKDSALNFDDGAQHETTGVEKEPSIHQVSGDSLPSSQSLQSVAAQVL